MPRLTPEQLELRRTGVTASDMAAICGLDEKRCAVSVWLDKVGEPKDDTDDFKEMGHRLEDVVLDLYEEKRGVRLHRSLNTLVHPRFSFLLASPDAQWEDGSRLVEAKTTASWNYRKWGREGTDEVPERYLVQAAVQMMVTGIDACDVAVLIGGNMFRVYTVRPNPTLEARLVRTARFFWENYVLRRERPPVGTPDAVKRALTEAFKQPRDEWLEVDSEFDHAVSLYRRASERLSEAEAKKEEAANRLRELIGNATGVRVKGEYEVTWRPDKNGSRRLRFVDYRKG